MNSVKFKGFNHYPTGNAKLTATATSLQISDLGDTGLDGYQVVSDSMSFNTVIDPIKVEKSDSETTYSLGIGLSTNSKFGNIQIFGLKIVNLNGVQQIFVNDEDISSDSSVTAFNDNLPVFTAPVVKKKKKKQAEAPKKPEPTSIVSINIFIGSIDARIVAEPVLLGNGQVYYRCVAEVVIDPQSPATIFMPDGPSVQGNKVSITSIFETEEIPSNLILSVLGQNLGSITITDENSNF